MPLYDYHCEACGTFDGFAPLSACRAPACCPECGREAPRVIGGAPALSALSQAIHRAHALNERSADTPRSTRNGHGMGCGCCGGKTSSGRTRYTPDGGRTFQGARPWMISH